MNKKKSLVDNKQNLTIVEIKQLDKQFYLWHEAEKQKEEVQKELSITQFREEAFAYSPLPYCSIRARLLLENIINHFNNCHTCNKNLKKTGSLSH